MVRRYIKRDDRTVYCGVYRITAPNGKEYVGQSKDVMNRWHTYHRGTGKFSGPKFMNSIKEFGVDEHIFELVEECCEGDLRKREQYYIDLWQTETKGLNSPKSAKGVKVGTKLNKEWIAAIKLGRIGMPSPAKGKELKGLRIRNTQTGEEWKSAAQCARHYGVITSTIHYWSKVNKNNLIRL